MSTATPNPKKHDKILTKSTWQQACRHLESLPEPHASIFRKIIQNAPSMGLKKRNTAFETLVRSVVGQQISVKAADSVWQKLQEAFEITPQVLAQAIETPEALRGCGLSGQKVKYVTGIAQAFQEGRLQPEAWQTMPDEAVIQLLMTLPGIGRWTAEMFLMSYLLRPNVFAVDDLGLMKGIEVLYGLDVGEVPAVFRKKNKEAYQNIAAAWAPYKTVACWYVWQSLKNT